MVLYVSPSERNGGIFQFSMTMLKHTKEIGEECILFLPDTVDLSDYGILEENVYKYHKIKSIFINSAIRNLADIIIAQNPEMVVFLEDSLLMQQLNSLVVRKLPSTAIVVHDVIQHPYRNMSKRKIFVEFLRRTWIKKTIKSKTFIVMLSNSSREYFNKLYPKKNANVVVMRLGAHVSEVKPQRPAELGEGIKNYFLFFGRIDKYKGIENLCQAYNDFPEEFRKKNNLVIAGNGILSEEEKKYIDIDNHIHKIIRFIDDSEMVWLFENSIAVVLPYIEASQSGVLPIAYHFSKPVIVSNLRGLTENVENNKTGIIYNTISELTDALNMVSIGKISTDNVTDYYRCNMNWNNNIRSLLDVLQKNK